MQIEYKARIETSVQVIVKGCVLSLPTVCLAPILLKDRKILLSPYHGSFGSWPIVSLLSSVHRYSPGSNSVPSRLIVGHVG